MKIVHLTSVHSRYDIRIFQKQCRTLSGAGYDVTLIVADGKGDERINGVQILDVGKPTGRLQRIFKATQHVYKRALSLDGDIYQFHDPELLPIGVRLKKAGKVVIFDSHEDVPKQLLSKPYLPPMIMRLISVVFSIYERFACKKLDYIFAATPFIRDKFLKINSASQDINNFPMIGELDAALPWDKKNNEVCYVGGIASIRGIAEVVEAFAHTTERVRLNLVGRFSESDVEQQVKKLSGWGSVNQLGQLERTGVKEVLSKSLAGLVTFHPLPNHVDAQPNKMFEYMSAGIPVIASDFPLWRQIIDGSNCGVLVDPMNPQSIAMAIDSLARDPGRAKALGENGRAAVKAKYNWDIESKKLLACYAQLSNKVKK
ncbi:glycosyl transferase [Pseudomonas sp. 10-1B]|uniref:glycosyltransferase family 4 protein n=1 Tax=Pseudomonas sp. 10-1B TaxID=1546029 RepID=UPI00061E3A79|nr:glycosyltransferase family 4 protein [Pseudomonas sp. 10-1B]KIY41314.1 glycosyl transferase [Pseudomonas sp. 10-1B]